MPEDYSLIASHFKQDPRVQQAKSLLLQTLKDHQNQLTAIRPPQHALIQSYQETLEAFSQIRGTKLYFPYMGSGFGNRCLVELLDGSVKYDMINGIGPHFWGHNAPELIEVALNAALSDTIMQGHLQQNQEAFLLSQLLVQASGLDHCFLSTSGAMANENALKVAFQKKFPASRVLAFENCFMGRTLSLAQITDKPAFREHLPLQLAVDYVPFYDSQAPEASTLHAIQVLEQHLARYPGQHAVMCFELIQGEAGFNRGSSAFFRALMEILRSHEIIIFIDEVQTFGRTSQLFSYQYFELEDYVDIVSIGKLSQVCATLFRASLKPRAGLLSQTFTSSTVALHASRWMIQQLLSKGYFGADGKIMRLYARFEGHFKALEKQWPDRIEGPYGIGAMIAFTPFKGEGPRVNRFVQDLFQAGVIAFTAGQFPTRVRFLIPAGVMNLEEVDEVMQIVSDLLSRD